MSIQEILVTLIAAIISGVLATIITVVINRRKEVRELKRALASDLFGYKYQLLNNVERAEINNALNRVPIVFNDNKEVLKAFDELYDAISSTNPIDRKRRGDEALVTFYKEVCKAAEIKCKDWNDSRFMRVLS